MDRTEMKLLIDEIVELGNRLRRYNELDQRAKQREPASPAEIDAFARRFAEKVPPSFLELMSIYDGVECFDYVDVEIFSLQYLTENAKELEEEWVDAGKFERDEIFVFARSDFDAVAIAFRIRQRDAAGEMPVVFFDARGVLGEYASLDEYLRSRKAWFMQELALESADRADFKEDD